jgi:hypothetical protein
MREWKSAWRMARFGWRRDWPGMLFTLLFAVYGGLICGFTLDSIIRNEETIEIRVLDVITDSMYLMVFPVFGQLMNSTAIFVMRSDIYSKKLAHWRTMPIPLKTIVSARWLNAVLLSIVNGLVYQLMQFAVSPAIREQLSWAGWLGAGFVWFGYSLAIQAAIIWMEMGVSGRRYVVFYWVFVGCCLLLAGALRLFDVKLVRAVMGELQAGHYFWLAASAAVAAAAMIAGYRLTLRRLRERSYVF